MSSVHDIESAIKRLDSRELSQLSGRFDDYLAEKLGEAVDRALEQGKCRPLEFARLLAKR